MVLKIVCLLDSFKIYMEDKLTIDNVSCRLLYFGSPCSPYLWGQSYSPLSIQLMVLGPFRNITAAYPKKKKKNISSGFLHAHVYEVISTFSWSNLSLTSQLIC
jgi:hypothetical protein